MTAKPAKPDRYTVDKVGTQDPPGTEYFVLDVVNDVRAREALAYLGNRYERHGQQGKAQECFDQLHATLAEHKRVMDERNPKQKGKVKKENVYP